MSWMCPFFKPKNYGICAAQETYYIPSAVEKESYCLSEDFRSCALHDASAAARIGVVYHDGTYGTVEDFVLDELIEEAEIKKFCRLDGWVNLGCDPIRFNEKNYRGPEKRKL